MLQRIRAYIEQYRLLPLEGADEPVPGGYCPSTACPDEGAPSADEAVYSDNAYISDPAISSSSAIGSSSAISSTSAAYPDLAASLGYSGSRDASGCSDSPAVPHTAMASDVFNTSTFRADSAAFKASRISGLPDASHASGFPASSRLPPSPQAPGRAPRPVLVGLSGGADSVALADILVRLGYPVVALHCNFHLRGDESLRDEAFARAFACETLGIPFYKIDFDTAAYAARHRQSIEMAARHLRYAWFEAMRRRLNAQAIAVAHHRDDSVETLLMNLLRGSGIRGLTGIRPRNGYVIRPLLAVSRQEILDWLEARHLAYVTDSTNLSDEYTRNFIRHNVVPLLEKINPAARATLARSAAHLAAAEPLYARTVEEARAAVWETPRALSIPKLLAYPSPDTVLYEMLRPYGFTPAVCEEIFRALGGLSGKQFFSPSYRLVKDRDRLLLDPLAASPQAGRPSRAAAYDALQTGQPAGSSADVAPQTGQSSPSSADVAPQAGPSSPAAAFPSPSQEALSPQAAAPLAAGYDRPAAPCEKGLSPVSAPADPSLAGSVPSDVAPQAGPSSGAPAGEGPYEIGENGSAPGCPLPLRGRKITLAEGETTFLAGKYPFGADPLTAYFDYDQLRFPLTLRRWQQGDRFVPFGMKGSKKVSDYFTNRKFSRFDKENAWLLCSAGQIIWIVGERPDNRFRVRPETKNMLMMKISRQKDQDL